MSQQTSNSVIDFGNLSKPADTLVKKVSNAVGGVFAPYQVKRMAKAEAQAAMIKMQSQIEITDMHRRALHRWVEEEAQRQQNMEAITDKALSHLTEEATPDSMENDWIVNFFDKSRIVSDVEMQELWSKILAGEANSPGTYSKRTVNFLSDLEKEEAELFSKLCGFAWVVGTLVPLVFDNQDEIYQKHDISFSSLNHLESIGLIRFNHITDFVLQKLPKKLTVYYYSTPLKLEMPQDDDNELPVGQVLPTKVGHELAPICGSRPVEGFRDYVLDKWKHFLPTSEIEQ